MCLTVNALWIMTTVSLPLSVFTVWHESAWMCNLFHLVSRHPPFPCYPLVIPPLPHTHTHLICPPASSPLKKHVLDIYGLSTFKTSQCQKCRGQVKLCRLLLGFHSLTILSPHAEGAQTKRCLYFVRMVLNFCCDLEKIIVCVVYNVCMLRYASSEHIVTLRYIQS